MLHAVAAVDLHPAIVKMPLDAHSDAEIFLLSSLITLTPGTVSCDLAEDGSALLVHALHCPDPAATVDEIKTRYEARLKEIFR